MAMVKSTFGHRTVKLDNVKQNNIVYVDLSEKPSESVFQQEYRKAAKIIQHIITENELKGAKKDDCYHLCKNGKVRKTNLTAFQTAVPFIGDRGTGKSSVMCSILERLRCYNGRNPEAAFYLGEENNGTHFIAFDLIDANTLTRKEDVMEIILSRMLSYLEEFSSDYDFRELYQKIDELHEDLGAAYLRKSDAREDYGLTGLQRIADSQKSIESFRKLVEQFRKDISKYKFDCHPCYLVIALDDIDMYQGADAGMQDNQFSLLEHIYCHMRIPGLIVLMTYNENILKRKCNSHFERIYFSPHQLTKHEPTQAERNDIEELTGQFMSKLFPQEQRIYLPNYMLVDSVNQSNLYVKPTLDGNDGEKLIPPFTSTQELPVKEFVLRLIAHKTGICFDATGTKKHFFEPRNLRELGELFQVIDSLESISNGDSSDEQEATRSRNRQELLNYMYNQFALKYLDSEEYKYFRKLSALPLKQQDRMLVDRIRQHRAKVVTHPDSIGHLAQIGRDRWQYSYGELLHNLYFSTRIPKGEKIESTYFSKEFLYCIFGTHSAILNQTIREPDTHDKILEIIGSSIAGRWANDMLPDFHDENWNKMVQTGSISLPVADFFGWQIPQTIQTTIMNLLSGTCDAGNAKEVLRPFLESLVIAGMYFTSFPPNGLEIALDADLDVDANGRDKTVLILRSNSEVPICFNVMNFVINLYDALPKKTNQKQMLSNDGGKQKQQKNLKEDNGYLFYITEQLRNLGSAFIKQLTTNWTVKKESAEHIQTVTQKLGERVQELIPAEISVARRVHDASKRNAEKAKAWELLAHSTEINIETFQICWNTVIEEIYSDYVNRIKAWQIKYAEFPIVLPVQNFDMMYNIIKRLAVPSYQDVPEEAPLKEVYNYYLYLYESIVEELANQDEIYYKGQDYGFAMAFQNSVFYQVVTAKPGNNFYNPYIESVLLAMMSSVLPAQYARRSSGFSISL